jgi:hypothetical protein
MPPEQRQEQMTDSHIGSGFFLQIFDRRALDPTCTESRLHFTVCDADDCLNFLQTRQFEVTSELGSERPPNNAQQLILIGNIVLFR